jgi:hypothetical protein
VRWVHRFLCALYGHSPKIILSDHKVWMECGSCGARIPHEVEVRRKGKL